MNELTVADKSRLTRLKKAIDDASVRLDGLIAPQTVTLYTYKAVISTPDDAYGPQGMRASNWARLDYEPCWPIVSIDDFVVVGFLPKQKSVAVMMDNDGRGVIPVSSEELIRGCTPDAINSFTRRINHFRF